MGLSKNWNLPIYCSKITANLIVDILNVDPSLVSTLELNCPIMLTENTTVILYDANHCPGACIFLFTIYKDGDLTNDSIDNLIKYLHTGDFRANNNHISILKDVKLDILYLDDTYLNPSHKFPPQKQVLDAINSLAATLISGNKPQEIESKEDHKSSIALMTRWLNLANPLSKIIGRSPVKILFLVGSYTIGKERVFVSLAQSLQSKIYVSGRKYNVLSLLDDENITSLLTKNKTEADVHVVGMNQINKDFLLEYLSSFDSKKYTNVVMIKPTGWTFKEKGTNSQVFDQHSIKGTHLDITVNGRKIKTSQYGVPYSEHSSYLELEMFVKGFVHVPRQILATVAIDKQSEYQEIFDSWTVL